MPNTISMLIKLRMRYDSYQELPEMPPEEWWDYPQYINAHIEKLYPSIKKNNSVEVEVEEIED